MNDNGFLRDLNAIGNLSFDNEPEEDTVKNDFMGLSPMNTVSDFVTELYDGLFRDILGDDTMDRALGSFDRKELFKVMSRIFLQDGNRKLYEQLAKD